VRALLASRIVVDAEALRLRLHARRLVIQTVLSAVSLVFLLFALVMAHAAAWYWLRVSGGWMLQSTAALLAAGDLVVAGVLAGIAMRQGPGPAEAEARLMRQQATRALIETISWPIVILRVLHLVRRR
jgi:hypothetical protein